MQARYDGRGNLNIFSKKAKNGPCFQTTAVILMTMFENTSAVAKIFFADFYFFKYLEAEKTKEAFGEKTNIF